MSRISLDTKGPLLMKYRYAFYIITILCSMFGSFIGGITGPWFLGGLQVQIGVSVILSTCCGLSFFSFILYFIIYFLEYEPKQLGFPMLYLIISSAVSGYFILLIYIYLLEINMHTRENSPLLIFFTWLILASSLISILNFLTLKMIQVIVHKYLGWRRMKI